MFNLLHKYIAKKFVYSFFVTFFSLASIALLVDVIEMTRRSYDMPDVSLWSILVISFTKLPFLMSQILPFCIIIATIISLWSLTRTSELIIYRAVGMSAKNFLSPLVIIAFIIGIFATTVFNPFTAMMYNKHNKLLEKNGFSSDSSPFLSEDGLWLREKNDKLTSVIHAQKLNLNNNELELHDISVVNIKNDFIFVSRISAKKAIIKNKVISFPVATIFIPEKIPQQIENYEIKTNITINQLQENMATPEKISFWDMPRIISFFETSGLSSIPYKLYYYSLIGTPFSLAAFVLIIAPFILISNPRKSNIFIRVIMAIISGFFLFFFTKITMALATSSSIPVAMAIIIPIIIASLFGFGVILHNEDG